MRRAGSPAGVTQPGRLTARPSPAGLDAQRRDAQHRDAEHRDAPDTDAAGPGAAAGVHRLAGEALLVVPPALTGPAPLLVFFHGAGGTADDSLRLVSALGAERGALLLLPDSRAATWDLLTGRLGPDVTALDRALADVFQQHAVGRVALGGFSDGASYALSLGLANGDLADTVLAFSPGFAAPPDQVGRPRVWVSHGVRDEVLPVDPCGRRVVRTLRGAEYEVAYEEFDGGHVVTPGLLGSAADFWLGAATA